MRRAPLVAACMTLVDLLPLFFFLAAALYASVGHAGASAYLATMALVGVAPAAMRPTALLLNVCVAALTTAQFARVGAVPWRRLWPFLLGSVPATFLAARLPVPPAVFKALIGVALLLSAARLAWSARAPRAPARSLAPAPDAVALTAGGAIGVLAGITGTGGGVFLTPLLLFARWAEAKPAAGLSAAFILANSVAGLAGSIATIDEVAPRFPLLLLSAVAGGLAGSTAGARLFGHAALKLGLAAVLLVAAAKLLLM